MVYVTREEGHLGVTQRECVVGRYGLKGAHVSRQWAYHCDGWMG